MKKIIGTLSFASLLLSVMFITSCSKDDTTAPVVTLDGSDHVTLSLNTASYADPGATATDDEDGSVSVSSDFSSTNPNLNLAGTYTITYTAVDAAGNVGTAVREIHVMNDAHEFAGTYDVFDTCGTEYFAYTQVITASETVNNRIHFSKFANYANNTAIYATRLGDGSLEIPLQSATQIGSGSSACAVNDHRFSSMGNYTAMTTGFMIQYEDEIYNNISCNGTATCRATYIRQ